MYYFKVSFLFALIAFEVGAQIRFEIPGTRASILQPTDILTKPYFACFTVKDKYEMSIFELQYDFNDQISKYNTQELKKKGIVVYEESTMMVDDYKAKLIHVYSNPEANAVQCIISDSSFAIVFSTLYDINDTQLYFKIIDYYKSIKINKAKKIDWEKYMAFTFDKNSSFKFNTTTNSNLNLGFCRDPDTNKVEKSIIMALQYPNYGMFKTVEDFTVSSLSTAVFQHYEIDKVLIDKLSNLNGKSVYEFKFSGTNEKKEKHIIHAIFRITEATAIGLIATIEGSNDEAEIESFLKKVSFKE